jgi:Na+/melibiose symporter-like transporter
MGAALLIWMGGCPIDRDEVITETTRAALQAALNSFIEKLGEQLAGS